MLVSAVLAIGFLMLVFRKDSAFHLIPFVIHQSLFRGEISESVFVDIFDIIFSCILFFLFLKIIKSKS